MTSHSDLDEALKDLTDSERDFVEARMDYLRAPTVLSQRIFAFEVYNCRRAAKLNYHQVAMLRNLAVTLLAQPTKH